jgi:hypothetical protein
VIGKAVNVIKLWENLCAGRRRRRQPLQLHHAWNWRYPQLQILMAFTPFALRAKCACRDGVEEQLKLNDVNQRQVNQRQPAVPGDWPHEKNVRLVWHCWVIQPKTALHVPVIAGRSS